MKRNEDALEVADEISKLSKMHLILIRYLSINPHNLQFIDFALKVVNKACEAFRIILELKGTFKVPNQIQLSTKIGSYIISADQFSPCNDISCLLLFLLFLLFFILFFCRRIDHCDGGLNLTDLNNWNLFIRIFTLALNKHLPSI